MIARSFPVSSWPRFLLPTARRISMCVTLGCGYALPGTAMRCSVIGNDHLPRLNPLAHAVTVARTILALVLPVHSLTADGALLATRHARRAVPKATNPFPSIG